MEWPLFQVCRGTELEEIKFKRNSADRSHQPKSEVIGLSSYRCKQSGTCEGGTGQGPNQAESGSGARGTQGAGTTLWPIEEEG